MYIYSNNSEFFITCSFNIHGTVYWISIQYDKVAIFTVNTDKTYEEIEYTDSLGIRPLIVISKNYFN